MRHSSVKRDHILKIICFLSVLTGIILTDELGLRIFMPQLTFSEAMKYAPSYAAHDPLLPFSLKKDAPDRQISRYGEFDISARLNKLGYRGPEFDPVKKPGNVRILTVGNSMTYGWGVQDNETYSAQLEQILKDKGFANTQIINGGLASGHSPDAYYLYFKERGIKLKPDILIMGLFVWNDVTDLAETVWDKTGENGLPEKISLCCHDIVDGRMHNRQINFIFRIPILRDSHLFIFLTNALENKISDSNILKIIYRKSFGSILDPKIHTFDQQYQKLYQVMRGIKDIADKNGIIFLTVIIPVDAQIYPETLPRYGYTSYPSSDKHYPQTIIEKELDNLGIRYIDLWDAFNNQKARGYPTFKYDQHWNKLGHQIAAEEIAKYLTDKSIFIN